MTIDTAISGLPTCVRKAWLVLASGATIQLDNPAGGWMCQSLDLGTPIMRTVMNNNPDGDGIIDRTQYMGARTVTAAITALTGAGATSIDAVAASFAPYMVPSQRPVLHYVLDRPGAPERTLTLRPDAYDWPIVGAAQRDIALQWIAPNPISYDPTQQSLIVTTTTNQTLHSPGDVPVRPLLAITGPITTAKIDLKAFPTGSGSFFDFKVFFKSGFVIPAGQVVTVDCAAHTATITAGGSGSVLNQIDWTISVMWPVLPVNPGASVISMTGSATDVPTQCAVLWNDGYWT